MSDLEAIVPRIEGWRVVNPVPVYADDQLIGAAILELGDDPKTLVARITLDTPDPVEKRKFDGAMFGLNGRVVKEHLDAELNRVVDEIQVDRLVIG